MIPHKHKTAHLVVPGVTLLAAGILSSSTTLVGPEKAPTHVATASHSGATLPSARSAMQRLSRNEPYNQTLAETPATSRDPNLPIVTEMSGPADVGFNLRSVIKMQTNPATGHELRAERRELSTAIPDLYRGDSSPPPESLRFPLFDGKAVLLKALRHQSMGTGQGVVFAKAEGEPEGGHVLLSYVGTALAGMIHLPSRGEFYEIRTGPDGRSHIMTQLNPDKMPGCGGCLQHSAK